MRRTIDERALHEDAPRRDASAPGSIVHVHNEWDPLEEVVIGTAAGARVPRAGVDLFALEFRDWGSIDAVPSGPFPAHVLEETEEELERLCDALSGLGVKVRRPDPRDTSGVVSTPDWESDGFYDYCPRDVLLAVGETIVETPMALRSRWNEAQSYRSLMRDALASGTRWIAAPKPRLADDIYAPDAAPGARLLDHEPVFDAANVLRFGTDLLYLVSDTGNEMGWRWLQSVLGSDYTVHPCRNLYASTHVDSTVVPLQPGLVLLNPERVNDANMPDFLRGWDVMWSPDLVDVGFTGDRPYCSTWIGMNVLVVRPGLVIAEKRQPRLLRALEAKGIDVLPMTLTHARTLGGGFHCVSLDLRRAGDLGTYR